MDYDAVVIGAGIAGLTCAAYLSRAGCRVLLCEKNDKTGGLVNSFTEDGFVFDGGIRAFENSGIVLPMLRQLGIELPVVRSPVSIGIDHSIIQLTGRESLDDYEQLLTALFPQEKNGIAQLIALIRKVMDLMDILYGIDNPLFLDLGKDKEYLIKELLPWLIRYQLNIGKALRLNQPVNDLLRQMIHDESLIDMITQHFFKNTPSFFALSYFGLYLDYSYPKGGTGRLAEVMEDYIRRHGGEIRLNAAIDRIWPGKHQAALADGELFTYRGLVWAGDLKSFYRAIEIDSLPSGHDRKMLARRRAQLLERAGNDSILTVYLAIDQDKSCFADKCGAHMFYTPSTNGLHEVGRSTAGSNKSDQRHWLHRFFNLTTYEISCPVLRDASLAPPGQTGLIVSTLMDYHLVQAIAAQGWYEEFKAFAGEQIARVLEETLFPELTARIIRCQVSTPLTLERITGNSDGAVTGWAFAKQMRPVESRFKKIKHSIRTPFPAIFQAGQWTFSPSGLPVSILTGKMAADALLRHIKKGGRTG